MRNEANPRAVPPGGCAEMRRSEKSSPDSANALGGSVLPVSDVFGCLSVMPTFWFSVGVS